MGNYFEKVISIIAITQYLPKWFKMYKETNIKIQENDFVEWGQFIELDNYNRDKMS